MNAPSLWWRSLSDLCVHVLKIIVSVEEEEEEEEEEEKLEKGKEKGGRERAQWADTGSAKKKKEEWKENNGLVLDSATSRKRTGRLCDHPKTDSSKNCKKKKEFERKGKQ